MIIRMALLLGAMSIVTPAVAQGVGGGAAGQCSAALAAGCACAAPVGVPFVAALSGVSGDVRVFAAASDGGVEGLAIGDRVVVGKGAATLSFPNGCAVAMNAQSMVTLSVVEGCACAAPRSLVSTGPVQDQTVGLKMFALGSLPAVVGWVDSIIDDDDSCDDIDSVNEARACGDVPASPGDR